MKQPSHRPPHDGAKMVASHGERAYAGIPIRLFA